MAVNWSTRRQILYYIVAGIAFSALAFATWQTFFVHAPTCSDELQNGTEIGIDCGGTCALLCPNVAQTPKPLWQRSFEVAPHVYTAVAYIPNGNASVGAGAKAVHYTFSLYDEKNSFVKAVEGTVDLPPVQTIPIVEANIDVGTRTVGRTQFEFADEPMYWKKIPAAAIQKIRIAQTSPYQNNRLSATIANDALEDVKQVQVIAVLFDSEGVARAASRSTIGRIGRKSSEIITFTWPSEFPDIQRAEVTVLPSF